MNMTSHMWVLHVTQTCRFPSPTEAGWSTLQWSHYCYITCHLNPNYLSTKSLYLLRLQAWRWSLCSAPRERSLRSAATHRTFHLGKARETCGLSQALPRPHLLWLICWPSPLWPNKNSFNELIGLHCSPQLWWLERGSIKCLCCR